MNAHALYYANLWAAHMSTDRSPRKKAMTPAWRPRETVQGRQLHIRDLPDLVTSITNPWIKANGRGIVKNLCYETVILSYPASLQVRMQVHQQTIWYKHLLITSTHLLDTSASATLHWLANANQSMMASLLITYKPISITQNSSVEQERAQTKLTL